MAETDTVTHFDDDTEPAETEPPRGTRGRRTALIACAVVVVAAVAVVGALGLGGGEEKGPSAPPRAGSVVPVTRATLTERTDVDGQLGFGTEIPLPVKATGTVTWLPQQGATAERGDTLLRVDDRPVVLLYGSMPMYRDLGLAAASTETSTSAGAGADAGAGASDSASPAPTSGTGTGAGTGSGNGTGNSAPAPLTGMDVLQFETNLAALGYTGFTVDEKFTEATVRAVKRWQKSLGLAETGTVGVGDVIYSAGKVRIGQPGARLGAAVGENTLTYTGTARKVVVNASASDAGWAVRGTVVGIALPGGKSVRGEVASVGRQASAPEGGSAEGESGAGSATLPVTITIADQKSVGRLESGPVTVEYVGREVKDVLSVPVAALVALAEGGHGLETDDGRFVAVKTGLFADGNVQVSGSGVTEGMKVRIPE
ncbi:peptidoglycan-binding protein [Streptomyces sp. WI04-05B]|uniref:peptidoglycan-binding protein n=1 Tax=Streptomyces TaxID=1883 RepID=UPI0029AAF33A|nr:MULTISPECIES: peptidoglycan-binding protein [unclassified Streptomyces]MDX2544204.1 peptidoglycan-binding protein [Streptomyces sp. WI04-05B]MDX2584620.1 peptidoglycan-binding protein [Streptomyces sp. WI04-05A]MDX3749485.1 peptidoglycan-binding protein [Streptomyces sp. AK08-02]